MSYVALYRAYRPKAFNEVSGQKVIIKTLQNALLHDKIAHAYLFSGPRGTGKTSIAKIFAKAVNCLNQPTNEPCNQCDICKGIDKGDIPDVIEIDAASNNGVDEIRDLRDKVKYMPSVGKFKVYIIDEVHMLTTGAFNALLKTLEEPPKHVIFILATTEVHKIPPTILSRCQRFDFKNIETLDIIEKLNEIAGKEKIDISQEAIRAIAINSEGGLRDAISLLDQAISFADGQISEDDVHQVSGSVSKKALTQLLTAISNKEISKAMVILKDLLAEGKEITRIVNDLILALRDILIEKS
ncbi:MAG: DNA polymerase III subunit gamma/tau, partial [Tenericutes bacterium HGW-Tenericutes-3]